MKNDLYRSQGQLVTGHGYVIFKILLKGMSMIRISVTRKDLVELNVL